MRIAFLPAVLLALACSGDGGGSGGSGPSGPNPPTPSPSPPTSATVQATTASTFQPATVVIQAGGTVTWLFSSLGHNVNFDDQAGAPADITGSNTNTSISRTFPMAGTFGYECTLHPGMRGTVSVATPASPAPPPGGGY